MIGIEPNWNLMMWLILLYLVVRGLIGLIVGLAEMEKKNETHYTFGTAAWGAGWLVVVLIVLLL